MGQNLVKEVGEFVGEVDKKIAEIAREMPALPDIAAVAGAVVGAVGLGTAATVAAPVAARCGGRCCWSCRYRSGRLESHRPSQNN
uniref:Uncharacterized protein n=1 Tax=Globodera rostochiensis TaxID=31243 RepID=A0A914HNB9_GLORO